MTSRKSDCELRSCTCQPIKRIDRGVYPSIIKAAIEVQLCQKIDSCVICVGSVAPPRRQWRSWRHWGWDLAAVGAAVRRWCSTSAAWWRSGAPRSGSDSRTASDRCPDHVRPALHSLWRHHELNANMTTTSVDSNKHIYEHVPITSSNVAKCRTNLHDIDDIRYQSRCAAAALWRPLMVKHWSGRTYLLAKLMVEIRRGSVQTMLHDAPRPASSCSYSIEWHVQQHHINTSMFAIA